MKNRLDAKLWVAVRTSRGFVSDIRAYKTEMSAKRQTTIWRRHMNPDYDEAAYGQVSVADSKSGRTTHQRVWFTNP